VIGMSELGVPYGRVHRGLSACLTIVSYPSFRGTFRADISEDERKLIVKRGGFGPKKGVVAMEELLRLLLCC
jgi:hypothetical protein